jgi:hypothetical protein
MEVLNVVIHSEGGKVEGETYVERECPERKGLMRPPGVSKDPDGSSGRQGRRG